MIFFWKLTFYKIAIILPISDPVVDSDIGEGMADTAQIIQLNISANPAARHNMDKAVRGRVALSHDRQVAEGALRGTHPHRLPHQALTNITIILIKYLEVYGDIEEAVVITDRSTGKSRGYGFVSNFFS